MFRVKNLFFSLAFLAFSASLSAQKPERIAGDLLLSFEKTALPERVAVELSKDETGRETGFFLEKDLRGPMNIWLAHFDETAFASQKMLDLARRHPAVRVAQFNHIIKDRSATDFDLADFLKNLAAPDTVPNDPSFAQQWQYINTGASGGTVDADIDAELAWDIARGGQTPDGDTIVVCVVDGGFNYNHPDFVDVLWKNTAEIAGNGIDDDQNGYIDDVRGWNAGTNNDQITTNAGHGTPVCGIVGARGNNGIGVAGVNWNVKIMFVAYGNTTEANVIEAYSYPFWHRKKWNETAGQAGAMVVSTNSSWGIDFGKPADAPLWCAFYDSLGHEGIVSCGATINGNTNVDVDGDLPTACPSDFLLTVTNCARTGKKVGAAGYGLETIDLGSFGESAYTVTQNSYGGFGGTSGATPHVAGAVALMYSAPCGRLTKMAKTKPAEAALLAKKYLLETTDAEPTLAGKTVTGGRLNIHKALSKMMSECGACFEPFAVEAEKIGVDSAVLVFENLESGVQTDLFFRPLNTQIWTKVANVSSPFSLANLAACGEYEFQLQNICQDTTSSFSPSHLFKTDGCCVAPTGLAVAAITDSTAQVSWQGLTAAESFVLQISEKGKNAWSDLAVVANSLIINSLAACTDYEMRAQTVCDTGATAFGLPIFFKTKGCGACVDYAYCPSKSTTFSNEWIGEVNVAGTGISFLEAVAGYEKDTSGFLPLLVLGDSATIVLTPNFGGQAFNEYFRAWIDFNGDGILAEPSERVFDSGTAQNAAVSGKFLVPADAVLSKEGITRLRVSMKYLGLSGQKQKPCDASFNYGQVRDFCVALTTVISANEPTELGKITLQPNPTDGVFDLKMELEKAAETRLELFAATGQLIDYQRVTAKEDRVFERRFDLTARGAGLYFLKISTADGSVFRKVIRL